MKTEFQHTEKKTMIMEKCFNCFCENGLNNTGIKTLASACDMTSGNLYAYFKNLDELIIQSTAYCMEKVEKDFVDYAPKNIEELEKKLFEMPYWTSKLHGKKYRFMYQVYTSPKYLENGKEFFKGVNIRYKEYANQLGNNLGFPSETLLSFIYIFVRACVHFALFEDEEYLKSELLIIWNSYKLFKDQSKK